jgi:hypothetical protein
MQKSRPLSFLILCFFYFTAFIPTSMAGKWRVNNTGISAHFTSAQQAANSASVLIGDTLYFEGSITSYGSLNLTKRLVLIGPGYFLGQNPQTQADLSYAMIESLTFSLGSKGSVLSGMTLWSGTTIQDTAITLTRNNLGSVSVYGPSINNNITGNYIVYLYVSGSQGNTISNNLIIRDAQCWQGICFNLEGNSSATVTNNIFKGCQTIENCLYENNIATGTATGGNDTFTATNSTIYNNIGASTQYGTANGNQQNVDMALVFINSGSNDGRYQLSAGSPALEAGVEGVDCGIFGGPEPYVLSGIPNLPSIWYFAVDGNTVTVKARSH